MNALITRLLPFLLLRLPIALFVMAIGFVVTTMAGLFLAAFARRAAPPGAPRPAGARRPYPSRDRRPDGPSAEVAADRPRGRPEPQSKPWAGQDVEDARFEEIR